MLSASGLMAEEIKEIELKDGSLITEDVQSLANGVYKIRP